MLFFWVFGVLFARCSVLLFVCVGGGCGLVVVGVLFFLVVVFFFFSLVFL